MIDREEFSGLSEPEIVAKLIREIGPDMLGHFDGCLCARFSIRGVDVDISCGKSEARGVVISSRSGDFDHVDRLVPIGEALMDTIPDDGRGRMLFIYEPA